MEGLNILAQTLGGILQSFAPPQAVPAPAPQYSSPMASPVAAASVTSVGLQLLLDPKPSGIIFRAACNTAAVVYPVYKSFKAIESNKKEDDMQWLNYWIIYGTLSLLEGLTDKLNWFPYYYHAKFAFLVWLQLPNTRGAELLYTRYFRPTLLKYQPKLDVILDKASAFLLAVYNINKVPIDAVVGLLAALKAQAAKFVTWFTSDEGASSSSGATSTDKSAAATQFIKGA